MQVQLVNGQIDFFNNDKKLIGADSIQLKTADGKLLSQKFENFTVQHDENRSCLKFSDVESKIELEVICREQIAVLRLSGGIIEKQPVFGKQEFLAEKDAVSLSLISPGADCYTAVYQHKEWWIRPAFCKEISDVPENTQLLLWKTEGTYFAMLAVCGQQNRADINGRDGGLALCLSSNCAGKRDCTDIAAVISCGADPYLCIQEAVRTALEFARKPYQLRQDKPFPEIFEYLGWCSWDAFGHDVNEKDILCKLDELSEKNIPVQWVLIDDGWSEVDFDRQLLRGLDADRARFPGGLEGIIHRLKGDYGMRWVGVWQAVMGYWNGVDPASDAGRELGAYLEPLPNGKLLPKADATQSFGFWNHWHQYLRCRGVDFVKVDSQSSISLFYTGRRTFGEASRSVHTGLEASAALNFNGSLINCMGMAPEDVWNRPAAALSRNSDDFVPKVPHAIREHALQNAYNSLLHGNFYWEDWDMFWSGHEAAEQNAILRVLSGGPIYLSEPIGQANENYIFPLALQSGKILRCSDVGLPTLDCLFVDPVKGTALLKIFNRYQDNYAVGILNISESGNSCSASIGTADIPALVGKSVWLYDWKNRSAKLLEQDDHSLIEVEPDGAKLFLLLPKTGKVTVLGLVDKYLSFAAVEELEYLASEVRVKLPQGGMFAFLSTDDVLDVQLDGVSVSPLNRGSLHFVECPVAVKHEIRISLT